MWLATARFDSQVVMSVTLNRRYAPTHCNLWKRLVFLKTWTAHITIVFDIGAYGWSAREAQFLTHFDQVEEDVKSVNNSWNLSNHNGLCGLFDRSRTCCRIVNSIDIAVEPSEARKFMTYMSKSTINT